MNFIIIKSQVLSSIFENINQSIIIVDKDIDIEIDDDENIMISDVYFNILTNYEQKTYDKIKDLCKSCVFLNKYLYVEYFNVCVEMISEKILNLEFDKSIKNELNNDIINILCESPDENKNNVIKNLLEYNAEKQLKVSNYAYNIKLLKHAYKTIFNKKRSCNKYVLLNIIKCGSVECIEYYYKHAPCVFMKNIQYIFKIIIENKLTDCLNSLLKHENVRLKIQKSFYSMDSYRWIYDHVFSSNLECLKLLKENIQFTACVNYCALLKTIKFKNNEQFQYMYGVVNFEEIDKCKCESCNIEFKIYLSMHATYEMLVFVHSKCENIFMLINNFYDNLIMHNDKTIIKKMHENKYYIPPNICNLCIKYNSVVNLRYFYENEFYLADKDEQVFDAKLYDCFVYLCEINKMNIVPNDNHYKTLCKVGHLKALKCLHKIDVKLDSFKAKMYYTIYSYEIMQYLYDIGCYLNTDSKFYCEAVLCASNSYELLKFLNETCKIPVPKNIINQKYTVFNRTALPDLKVIKYLCENLNYKIKKVDITHAIKFYNNFDIFQYCLKKYGREINLSKMLDIACCNGNLKIVKYIYVSKYGTWSEKTLLNCVKKNRLDCYIFAEQNNAPCKELAEKFIKQSNIKNNDVYYDIVEYINKSAQ